MGVKQQRVCDDKIHKANKLASKHQRIRLFNSTMPECDICQDMIGYFFCLEDRALLCRKWDFSIHTANPFVSGHQRFLLTGARVGLEPIEPVAPTTKKKPSVGNETTSQAVPRMVIQLSFLLKLEDWYPGTKMLLEVYHHLRCHFLRAVRVEAFTNFL